MPQRRLCPLGHLLSSLPYVTNMRHYLGVDFPVHQVGGGLMDRHVVLHEQDVHDPFPYLRSVSRRFCQDAFFPERREAHAQRLALAQFPLRGAGELLGLVHYREQVGELHRL